MTDNLNTTAQKKLSALEAWLVPIFAKLPHIPQNAREAIAKISPWLALIFGILGLLGILSAGGLAMILSVSLVGLGLYQISLIIAVVFGVVSSVLNIMAYKPLLARKKKGWNLLFYGTVLSAVATIINLFFAYGSLGSIVGLLIGFWLLFEIRDLYTDLGVKTIEPVRPAGPTPTTL